MNDIELAVDYPKVGDPASKMPRKIKAAVEELDSSSWLTASAQWNTSDGVLENNRHYYLTVTFTAAGHGISDNQKMTINGEEPMDKDICYKNGSAVVTAVWKYTFGTPKSYTVQFDTSGHGEAPEAMQIEAGTMLKYVDKPDDPAEEGYRFDGWIDLDNKAWDDVIVTSNKFFNAKWVKQVDKVAVSFSVPRVGKKWQDPTIATRSSYHIDEISVSDEDYNDVGVVKKRVNHSLSFTVHLNGSDSEFTVAKNEDDCEYYTGTVMINGKEADDVEYNQGQLRVNYTFKPLPRKPKLSKTSITVKKGKTKTIRIIGKDSTIKNVYKNTKYAKVVSKKTAGKIKIKGLKKGKTTIKIKANGVWLKLKVKVK